MQGHSDRPEAVFAALADGSVIGYGKLSMSSVRPGVAMHDLLAVKRAWRRRGVAGALKRAEIAWAKRHGYVRLETHNEIRNEAIRRLNEQPRLRDRARCRRLPRAARERRLSCSCRRMPETR